MSVVEYKPRTAVYSAPPKPVNDSRPVTKERVIREIIRRKTADEIERFMRLLSRE